MLMFSEANIRSGGFRCPGNNWLPVWVRILEMNLRLQFNSSKKQPALRGGTLEVCAVAMLEFLWHVIWKVSKMD
jgi:hypothetical protein